MEIPLTNCDADSNSRSLRVMFVITAMHVGGAETLAANLIRRLDRARFSPELCCLKVRGELGEALAEEIPVHANLLRHKYDLGVLWRLTRLLRQRRIDAVVTVGAGDKMFWGRLAARCAGVPLVVSALHSTGFPDHIKWLNRRLTPLTDAFIAVAERHAQYLVEQIGLPPHRVHVIPNGVDTERFHPNRSTAELRQELGIPPAAPLAGIVAILRQEKNHEMFLRVAARVLIDVPEAHFLIIGEGPRRTALERLADQLGLSSCVHFLGQRCDVPDLLSLLDVFVLTSRIEANPVSILEAMATARPVVATRVGSIPEVVRDGQSGYLVDAQDDASMARRVADLLLQPGLAQQLGANGRQEVVSNWSIDQMVAGYERLLERIWLATIGSAAGPLAEPSLPEDSSELAISAGA